MLPSVGASAGMTKSNNGYEGAARGAVPEMQSGSVGLDVSWEIDITGRLRAGAKAAAANVMATQGAARGLLR